MTIVLAYPPRPKWIPYYWECAKYFGQECYRTWKEELGFAVIAMVVAYLFGRGADPRAWADLQIAFVSSGITLGIFAVYHLIRVPFFVHAYTVVGDPNTPVPSSGFGILGVLVLLGMVVGGGLLGRQIYAALPQAQVEIVIRPPAAPVIQITREPIITASTEPKQRAYMVFVEPEVKYQVGSPLATGIKCMTTSDVPAQRVSCSGKAFVLPVRGGEVSQDDENSMWKQFEKTLTPLPESERPTVNKGENLNGPIEFPGLLTEEQHTQLESGNFTLLVTGALSYKDDAGTHRINLCRWAQPPLSTTPRIWHYCKGHEGIEY
jgi:hypothetical protein